MTKFFDTNVLVYSVTTDARAIVAREEMRAGGITSVQVLNEFVNVALKKLHQEWPEIERAVEDFLEMLDAVVPLTLSTHRVAFAIARDHKLAFYDALIVASAIEAGCNTLVTEDMQDGRVFSGLTICNPFRRV